LFAQLEFIILSLIADGRWQGVGLLVWLGCHCLVYAGSVNLLKKTAHSVVISPRPQSSGTQRYSIAVLLVVWRMWHLSALQR